MKRFRGILAFLTLALAVWTPGLAHAQGLSGQIGGSVVDSSKGAVPGATVTVRNTATAVTRDVVTDSEGLFVFTNLFAGTYDLRVTLTELAAGAEAPSAAAALSTRPRPTTRA